MDPFEKNIKNHFDNQQFEYKESHWAEAKMMIDQNNRKKRRWFFWWTGAVGGLALLLGSYWSYTDIQIIREQGPETKEMAIATYQPNASKQAESNLDENLMEATSDEGSFNSTSSIRTSKPESAVKKLVSENQAKSLVLYETENVINSKQELISDASEHIHNSGSKGIDNEYKKEAEPDENVIIPSAIESEVAGQLSTEGDLQTIEQRIEKSVHTPSENIGNTGKEDNTLHPVAEENIQEEKGEEEVLIPINPKINSRFKPGIVTGYLAQNSLSDSKWLSGVYVGGRIGWMLSPLISIGTDITLSLQQINSAQYFRNSQHGYGFGRDSIVVNKYAKNALAIQTPIYLEYTKGQHNLALILGTRILIHANARMEKVHYTNGDPSSQLSPVLSSRSTELFKREESMPRGIVSPFSVFAGFRYGWMIGKGWGMETSVTSSIYRKNSGNDFGADITLDKGIRVELGVVKVF